MRGEREYFGCQRRLRAERYGLKEGKMAAVVMIVWGREYCLGVVMLVDGWNWPKFLWD